MPHEIKSYVKIGNLDGQGIIFLDAEDYGRCEPFGSESVPTLWLSYYDEREAGVECTK